MRTTILRDGISVEVDISDLTFPDIPLLNPILDPFVELEKRLTARMDAFEPTTATKEEIVALGQSRSLPLAPLDGDVEAKVAYRDGVFLLIDLLNGLLRERAVMARELKIAHKARLYWNDLTKTAEGPIPPYVTEPTTAQAWLTSTAIVRTDLAGFGMIVRKGVGRYWLYHAPAMPDADYLPLVAPPRLANANAFPLYKATPMPGYLDLQVGQASTVGGIVGMAAVEATWIGVACVRTQKS